VDEWEQDQGTQGRGDTIDRGPWVQVHMYEEKGYLQHRAETEEAAKRRSNHIEKNVSLVGHNQVKPSSGRRIIRPAYLSDFLNM